MAFTKEQIEEIRVKLEQNGSIKDSDLPEAGPLKQNEEIVILQESKNVRTKVLNLVSIVSKFKGYFTSENQLFKIIPLEGDYAYVGPTIGESTVYIVESDLVWTNSEVNTIDYIKVIVTGAVSVGDNGNWHNGAVDTGIPARGLKGDPFTYLDFTHEQIESIKKPSYDAALLADEATNKTTKATIDAITATRAAVDGAALATSTAVNLQDVGTQVITNTNIAIERANNATTQAMSQATLANEAAIKAFGEAQIANTAADRAEVVANSAEDLSQHPTYIGTDWYVYIYNRITKTYSKSSIYVKGEPFLISKVFKSIAEMNVNLSLVQEGMMVLINNTDDVLDENNSKVFTRTETDFAYLYKLSNLVGETGKTPIIIEGVVTKGDIAAANLEPNGTDERGNPIYKFNAVLPRGDRGVDGATPTGITDVGIDPNTGDRKFTLNFSNGKNYVFTSQRGIPGAGGTHGVDGANPTRIDDLGVDSVTGEHKYSIVFSNNTSFIFNSPKGDRGPTGLQGLKGNTGEIGPKGNTGETGYTPVKGVDYWTTAEVTAVSNEIKRYVDQILGVSNQLVLDTINRI